MKNPDQLWLDIVHRFAAQSRCQSRQVGAILVKDNRLISEGWNSPPKGSSATDCPRCKVKVESGKGLEFAICAHAEANAIANGAYLGASTLGSTIYCTTYPCAECAKLIVGAGVVEVVYQQHYDSPLTDMIFKAARMRIRSFFTEVSSPAKDHSSES